MFLINLSNTVLQLHCVCGLEKRILCFSEIKGFLSEVKSLRDEVLAAFERAMLGDRLAAEFLLCHILSNV